jgi:hypothetical protein
MNQIEVAGLSHRKPEFASVSIHVEFAVDKVTLGQEFLPVLQFFHINIIPPWFSVLIYHLGDEK